MATVVLIGTLDTKGEDYGYVHEELLRLGVDVVVIDVGLLGGSTGPPADIDRGEVARAGNVDLAELASGGRNAGILAMADAAGQIILSLHEQGRCDAAMALGGSGGTALAARAFSRLPIGVPKVIVSTVASGDTSAYIAETDLVLMPSVVDVAGINRISSIILTNAANAVAGMAEARHTPLASTRTVVAASMFGVTTPCVTQARHGLEAADYEVLVFHMTGVGGRTMERLAGQGAIDAILDATTTELADELVGGVFSAGPTRLVTSGAAGIPRVVSVGALDMVNFGAPATVPPQFRDRLFHNHNSNVTLMRTTADENTELGRILASRLNASAGPVTLFIPLLGVSAIDAPGQPFHDPAADAALFASIRNELDSHRVRLVELPLHVNDPAFANAMVAELNRLLARDS